MNFKLAFLFALGFLLLGSLSTAHAETVVDSNQDNINSVFTHLWYNHGDIANGEAMFEYCLDKDYPDVQLTFESSTASKDGLNLTYGYYTNETTDNYINNCTNYETVEHPADAENGTEAWNESVCTNYEQVYAPMTTQVWNDGLPSTDAGCYNVTVRGNFQPNTLVDWIPTLTIQTTNNLEIEQKKNPIEQFYDWASGNSPQESYTQLTKSDWAWWNNSWGYYKILNLSTNIMANNQLQFRLNISYTAHMNPDFSDLRFTTINGTETTVPYWIESESNSSWAIVWLDTNLTLTNTTHYMYYGNSLASTTSDPVLVFPCYDTFDGTSLNSTKWDNSSTGTISYAMGNSLLNWTNTQATTGIICHTGSINRTIDNIAIRTKFYHLANYDVRQGLTNVTTNTTRGANAEGYVAIYSNYQTQHQQTQYDIRGTTTSLIHSGSFRLNSATNEWNSTFYLWNSTIGTMSLNETNGTNWYNVSSSDTHINDTFYLTIDGGNTAMEQYDEIFMYRFPSGTVTALYGAEQTISAPNTPTLNSPTNGSTGNSINTTLQATCTDANYANVSLIFYNGANNAVICTDNSVNNNTLTSCTWSGLTANTNYKWYVNCSNLFNTVKSAVNNFTTEVAPSLSSFSPANLTTGSSTNITLSVTGLSMAYASVNITFYNATSAGAFSGCSNLNTTNNTAATCSLIGIPANTSVGWYAQVVDTSYSTTSSNYYFTTDTVPTVTVNSPTNTTYTTLTFWANSTSDKSTNWTYSLDGGANVSIINASTSANKSITTTSGAHNITIYLKSSAGYSNASAPIYFTMNLPPTIVLNAPANSSTNNPTIALLQVTCTDPDSATLNYTTYVMIPLATVLCTNTSVSNNTLIGCTLMNLGANTVYKWGANCTDGVSTINSGISIFQTDTIPQITINSPQNITYGTTLILLNTSSDKSNSWMYSLDGVANVSYNTSYCYQESANVSNQTGIDGSCGLQYTGTYNETNGDGLWRDGDWNTYTSGGVTPNNFVGYVNYTKPTNAKSDSLLEIKISSGTTINYTIPSDCWNYNSSVLMFSVDAYQYPFPARIYGLDINCYNGSWVTIYSTHSVGINPRIWEEAMLWSFNNAFVDITSLTGSHNITIYANSSSGFTNSSVQYFSVDVEPPTYSDITNPLNPQLTTSGLISAKWQDNRNLSMSMFSTNITGSWVNASAVAMTGTTNWSNVTVTLPNYPTTYYYIIYANDSLNNQNETGIQSFNVICDASTFTISQDINGKNYDSCNININATTTNFTSSNFTNDLLYINVNDTSFNSNNFVITTIYETNSYMNTVWNGNTIDNLTYIGSNNITQDKSFSQPANLLINNPTKFWANFTDNALPFSYIEFSLVYNYTSVIIPGTNYTSSGSWSNLNNFNDSNWGTYANDASGTAIVNFSYAVPTYADRNESFLDYMDFYLQHNITIPSDCWGSTVKLEAISRSAPNNSLYCRNITDNSWVLLYNSTTATAHNRIYESEFHFQIVEPTTWYNMTHYGNGLYYINYTIPVTQADADATINYRWTDPSLQREYTFSTFLRSLTISDNSSLGTQILCAIYKDETNESGIPDMLSQATFNLNDNSGNKYTFYVNTSGNPCYYTTTSANNLTYDVQINYQKQQNASEYATRSFIHYGYGTAGFANLTLYDMPPQYFLTFRALDVSTSPIGNLLVVAKRLYPNISAYESVDMCSTRPNGECDLWIYLNNVFYQIDVYNGNQLVGQINPTAFGSQYANGIKDYDFFITNSTPLMPVDNTQISYNITYNPSTQLVIATISGANVSVTPYTFIVYQKFGFNNYVVYNNSTSAPVATFIYNVTNSTGSYYATLNGHGIAIGSTTINLTSAQATENGIAIILMIAAMGVIFALALVSPIVGLIVGVLIIIIFTTMGFLKIQDAMLGLGGLITALAFYMWRYFK